MASAMVPTARNHIRAILTEVRVRPVFFKTLGPHEVENERGTLTFDAEVGAAAAMP